jgi:phosphoribosylanthranilate isomerase
MASPGKQDSGHFETLIKICGVTTPDDAHLAAAAGADFIGMIMWPKAKRAVQLSVARSICSVAAEHNAHAVGVFVDEDARTIEERCREAGIGIAQLHGSVARQAVTVLPKDLEVIYVMHADKAGQIRTPTPADLARSMGLPLSR